MPCSHQSYWKNSRDEGICVRVWVEGEIKTSVDRKKTWCRKVWWKCRGSWTRTSASLSSSSSPSSSPFFFFQSPISLTTASFSVCCSDCSLSPPVSSTSTPLLPHVFCTCVTDRRRQQTKSLHAWFCLALYDRYAAHPTLSLFHSVWCTFNERHVVSMTPLCCLWPVINNKPRYLIRHFALCCVSLRNF